MTSALIEFRVVTSINLSVCFIFNCEFTTEIFLFFFFFMFKRNLIELPFAVQHIGILFE